MTCQELTDALIDAASSNIGDEFRVGVINAPAMRRGSSVGEALRKCCGRFKPRRADRRDRGARPVIPTRLMTRSLPRVRRAPDVPAKRAAKARLRLAENLARSGDKQAARKIYDAIAAGKYDPAQQKAAKAALERLA